MTSPRYALSTTGSLPWTGSQEGSNAYSKAEYVREAFDPVKDLHRRRSLPELEELLAERLAVLRARPDHHLIVARDLPDRLAG